MSNSWSHTDEELEAYFTDPEKRRQNADGAPEPEPRTAFGAFFYDRFDDPKKAQAALVLSVVVGLGLAGVLFVGILLLAASNDLPSLQQLENPQFQLATIAYTADGQELARYASQNRSWTPYEEISPYVVEALVATEDHRFYEHWGMDLFRTVSAVGQTVLGKLNVPGFETQGGSTITQQLARNLYNDQIGREQTVTRKLKEMVTAVQLERRYTKREIIEMYLNTVEFGYNAFGIESGARTFFGVPADSLDALQAATLVGMQKAITAYNPIRNPERSQQRRNVVLAQMVKNGYLDRPFFEEHRDDPIGAEYHSTSVTASLAPHFAMYVRDLAQKWAEANKMDIYEDGLRVYTTLDSRMQELAMEAVQTNMQGLQAVVDYEWSRPSNYFLGESVDPYVQQSDYTPFEHFWSARTEDVNAFIRETERYRRLVSDGANRNEALRTLKSDDAYMDSLRTAKTRLEAGFVALDPRTGSVRAWVGGRDYREDQYDKVALAQRQPGSTFKPFVYTVAIDNGYSPYQTYKDTTYAYVREGNTWRILRPDEERPADENRFWQPGNSDGGASSRYLTLRECLARSLNTCTGQLVMDVRAPNVASYAYDMGIKSVRGALDQVSPAIALGTIDVNLLEMTSAYATLANGGLYHEPQAITRITDRFGNVLYEPISAPHEALSEETAYTVVDMLRAVIQQGTGIRIRGSYGLTNLDLAGKTGTTQNSADGWFMLMHPELVMGSWVGFNDRRVTFRTNWWGQGAHNALFIVGDFMRKASKAPEIGLNADARFPTPDGLNPPAQPDGLLDRSDRRRTGW